MQLAQCFFFTFFAIFRKNNQNKNTAEGKSTDMSEECECFFPSLSLQLHLCWTESDVWKYVVSTPMFNGSLVNGRQSLLVSFGAGIDCLI